MAGGIDMIITKSISRFAHNPLDCLKGEVLLTIMASLAQQESQSLSQNVKLGLQYHYQQGEIQVSCTRFLGYSKDENKHLVVVPKKSEIIKHIYREYLEGASIMKIAHGLDADGNLNGSGEERWHTNNISQILWTVKYIGDARTVPESKSSRY